MAGTAKDIAMDRIITQHKKRLKVPVFIVSSRKFLWCAHERMGTNLQIESTMKPQESQHSICTLCRITHKFIRSRM